MKNSYFLLYFMFFLSYLLQANMYDDPHFVILIASYNNKKLLKENLDSVFSQDYPYVRVVYIDDNSSDMTADEVEKYVNEHKTTSDFKLVRNAERRFKVANFYDAIHQCNDEEIIIELDGDDLLYSSTVLSTLADVYRNEEIWMTYGQYITDGVYRRYKETGKLTGIKGWKTKQVPQKIIESNAFREYHWVTSHLRTYYAWLFKLIKLSDLIEYNAFYPVAGDIAMTIPMLEMAGFHSYYQPKILYVWNNHSPLNDFRKRPGQQVFTEWKIRKQDKYLPLSYSKSGYLNNFDGEKVNIIIISQDVDRLNKFLNTQQNLIQDIDRTVVVFPEGHGEFYHLASQWPEITFKSISFDKPYDIQKEIMQMAHVNRHLVLMNDLARIDHPIALNRAVKLLEETQVDLVLLDTKKNDIPAIQRLKVFQDVYAWDLKYMNHKDFFSEPSMILYRCSDLHAHYQKSHSIDAGLHVRNNYSNLAIVIDWSTDIS